MRRRLTTLKAKSGGVQNGNGAGHPRALIDLAIYREHRNNHNIHANTGGNQSPHWDPQYSGWSNGGRPGNHAIFLRPVTPLD